MPWIHARGQEWRFSDEDSLGNGREAVEEQLSLEDWQSEGLPMLLREGSRI